MFYIAVVKPIGGKLSWQIMGAHPAGYKNRPGLTITDTFYGDPPTRREAVELLAESFLEERLPWFSLRGNEWVVDLDKLRSYFELPACPDLEGLEGVTRCTPEYDIEERTTFKRQEKHGVLRLVLQAGSLQDVLESVVERRARVFDERKFHREVVGVARPLFVDGHFRSAVHDATIRVIELVKTTAGSQRDGRDLMMNVFNGAAPTIALNGMATQPEIDEQEGYKFLFAGMVAALRNPPAHSTSTGASDELTALEQLVFVSLLLRKLDSATS